MERETREDAREKEGNGETPLGGERGVGERGQGGSGPLEMGVVVHGAEENPVGLGAIALQKQLEQQTEPVFCQTFLANTLWILLYQNRLQKNHFLAGQLREIHRFLEPIQLGEAPQTVLIAVEEAKHAAKNSNVVRSERLRGTIEEGGDREGDGSLRCVEDLRQVLTALSAAFHATVHILRVSVDFGK